MRKENVWKQALALVLSATLVLGNVSPVSAAAGDTAAGNAGATAEGTGNGSSVVDNPDAYKELKFDFEDGQQTVSGDDALYIENGITFVNQCSQKVVTNDQGEEVISDENPNMSKGAEVVNASDIPDATEEDAAHGKVLKFDKGATNEGNKTTGIDYLTTADGALASYDYSNGVTFSFEIRPEAQGDWNYLFAFGQFMKYNVTGTIGFIAGYESLDKKPGECGGTNVQEQEWNGKPWTPFYPGGNFLNGNTVNSAYNFFENEGNAGKWYKITYVYTAEGLTINVDDVPAVSYTDPYDHMEELLKKMSKGQLRLGKGVLPDLEGFVGYMDNVTIQPVHPGEHEYVDIEGSTVDPDCVTPGSKKKKCSMCGVIATDEITALGHDFGELVTTNPTCKNFGYTAHYECKRSGCSQWAVADATVEGGIKEISSKTSIRIEKLDHSYDAGVVTKKATPTADGEITKTCNNSDPAHTETDVIAKASNITLKETSCAYTGKPITPAVTVKDSAGNVIANTNYKVTYTNNTNVGKATATIEFDSDKYEGTVNKDFTITVAASLKLNKSTATLYTGKASNTITVKVTAVTGASNTVTWTSDKKGVAKVDSKGKITAVGKGTATITATANGVTQKVKVTVKNPTITVKNGKKKASSVTVKKGKKVTLTVTTNPKKAGSGIAKLSAKDKKVASVSIKKGKITIKGKKKGSLTIKVTSGKATKKIKVKVK